MQGNRGEGTLLYISDPKGLKAFIEEAGDSKVLAIDTEFLREKTYYPRLCLVQMATDTQIVLIDPFKTGDLRPLSSLLLDEGITKVFHAGAQDFEILYRVTGVLPRPVFDTQMAAALLGHSQHMSYASLVQAECGVKLGKADSFTDWSLRPLSESQLQYAADDVVYLPKLYEKMYCELKKLGRLDWLLSDFSELTCPERYEKDVRESYRRLKHVGALSRRQLSAAREVAAWRETQARERDIPRRWMLADEQIVEMCKREARSVDEMFVVRGVGERLSMRDAREVARLLRKGLSTPPDTWPEYESVRSEPNVKTQLDLMISLVRLRAKENDVAFQTLATKDDLARLARGYEEGIELLRGWRRALVGEELLRLLNGEISLSLADGKLVVTDISLDAL